MLTLILYAPGTGGNHLRNLIALGGSFDNALNIDYDKIYWHNPESLIGEVPAQGGRNVHEWNMRDIITHTDRSWLLACHFGEIAAWAHRVKNLDVRAVSICIDRDIDQTLLQSRQDRLGQHSHPYWIAEEFPWLYQPLMLEKYFHIDPAKIQCIPMADFWANDIRSIVTELDSFLGTQIPTSEVENLHSRWRLINRLT